MDLEFPSYIETLWGRDDIWTNDWTKKPFCDTVRAWIKLQHAHEELDIIAVEARRLTSSIENEEAELAATIDQIKPTNAQLVQYLSMSFLHWTTTHIHLHTKLAKLKKCSPYNGVFESQGSSNPLSSLSPSNQIGSDAYGVAPKVQLVQGKATSAVEYSEDELEEEEAHKQSNRAIDRLVDVFSNLDVMQLNI